VRQPSRRRGAILAVFGLALSTVPIALAGGVARAASQTTTNACFSNATATYSDLDWTLAGSAAPSPATLGAGNVTLSGSTLQVDIPATLLVAGYNLGLLTVGANSIPTTVFAARQATNAATTSAGQTQVGSDVVQVDSFTVTASTTITDPNGIPGSGDESATPLNVVEPLPNMVVTPTGGQVQFRQADIGQLPLIPAGVAGAGAVQPNGSLFATASVAGGLIRANFDCFQGTTIIDPPGGTSGTTYTPAPAAAFETVTVIAPPTAPVCEGESVSVGVGQSIAIDLTGNCTDVNVPPDAPSNAFSVTALTPASPAGGDLAPTGTPGIYQYTAPATDPGPVTFDFTLADSGGLVSDPATVTVTVLANQCDATVAPCSLTEVVVQPVVGTAMTMDKVPGFVVMPPVILNGEPQVSTGSIQAVTVKNARGSAAGWDVTGYVTDLGTDEAPTISPIPGISIPACSAAGSLTLQPLPDRNCIPGDNLAWGPSAVISHERIGGDVAHVVAGTAHATDAADWLAQLIAAGADAPASDEPPSIVPSPDGLGGLQEINTLCQAPVNQAGGMFTCDAALYLGVPASAGAGNFTGALVLTLT
jgi:hypothetical protein